jgi:hypothetical protein
MPLFKNDFDAVGVLDEALDPIHLVGSERQHRQDEISSALTQSATLRLELRFLLLVSHYATGVMP